ncbi:MAG: hydroxymethylglutaryl-CoA synthase, partial [Leuconostoc falkenbergense]
MNIGIDKIAFYTPEYVLDLVTLAKARGDEPDKYTIGIGQDEQAVIPNYEDVVTMGANAARQIVNDQERQTIDMVVFATESGIDNSKSSAIYVQKLLQLSEF